MFLYFSNCIHLLIIIHLTLILCVPHFFSLDFENSSFSLVHSTNHYYLLSTGLYFLTSNYDQSLLYLNPSVTLIAFRMEFRIFFFFCHDTRSPVSCSYTPAQILSSLFPQESPYSDPKELLVSPVLSPFLHIFANIAPSAYFIKIFFDLSCY